MSKKKYYDISNILSTDAEYMILLGQRANGKSYQVKKTVLENAYNDGSKFVYLRRYQADTKMKQVEAYFSDMPIVTITHGEYDCVVAWQGFLYFAYRDEEHDKIIRGREIGRYCALNESIRYKSQVFLNYKYIVYEEFISDKFYLLDEPMVLQQFVSTVARHEKLTVFLIGNTISRVCPYFTQWGLDGVLKQKQGTIELYHFHINDSVIDIAVEYCENANYKNKMFFGKTSKQIVSGEWETKDLPKLLNPLEDYTVLYEILVSYMKFKFVMMLLCHNETEQLCVYVYPYTGHRKITRCITDEFSLDIMTTNRLNLNIPAEQMIAKLFAYNKVCYSDNLTGSDFRQLIDIFRFV